MIMGTYMGGFWILKFIFFPLGLTNPFLLFLFLGLTICVPFMAYYYTKMYRNRVCGGAITFSHAWSFTTLIYFFAALLTFVAHYVYFRFIDHGYILNTYESMINEVFAQASMPGLEGYETQFRDAIAQMQSLSSFEIALELFLNNIFYGTLLAIPTALFVMRRTPATNGQQPIQP